MRTLGREGSGKESSLPVGGAGAGGGRESQRAQGPSQAHAAPTPHCRRRPPTRTRCGLAGTSRAPAATAGWRCASPPAPFLPAPTRPASRCGLADTAGWAGPALHGTAQQPAWRAGQGAGGQRCMRGRLARPTPGSAGGRPRGHRQCDGVAGPAGVGGGQQALEPRHPLQLVGQGGACVRAGKRHLAAGARRAAPSELLATPSCPPHPSTGRFKAIGVDSPYDRSANCEPLR